VNWMTLKEAAAYLQIQPRTLAKWTREGSVKAYPLHGAKRICWRFLREDLDAAMGYAPPPMLDSTSICGSAQ